MKCSSDFFKKKLDYLRKNFIYPLELFPMFAKNALYFFYFIFHFLFVNNTKIHFEFHSEYSYPQAIRVDRRLEQD